MSARDDLQGSVVMERAVASPLKRDAADVVTTLGWSRPIGVGISDGIEGIGQDLEGLWDPAEVDAIAFCSSVRRSTRSQKSGNWATRPFQ